jgi:hypothetical protein
MLQSVGALRVAATGHRPLLRYVAAASAPTIGRDETVGPNLAPIFAAEGVFR